MADISISDTGQWIDAETGKVVTSPPERGIQLVPPGGELTPQRNAAIAAAKLAETGQSTVETATSPAATENTARPSIKTVLADVGDDKTKAQAALDAERALDEPRKGIIEPLQKLLDAS